MFSLPPADLFTFSAIAMSTLFFQPEARIAAEIVEDLQAALAQVAAFASDLRQN
jgi:hypothetical protein